MRNGLKVFDVDTHVNAAAEVLEPYLSTSTRALVSGKEHRVLLKTNVSGDTMDPPYPTRFGLDPSPPGGWRKDPPRVLGEATPREDVQSTKQKFMGTKWPAKDAEWAAKGRIKDMDEEGVDTQVMVPGVPRGHSDPLVDLEFMRANHRFLNDFCGKYPHRLKSLLVLDARFIEESVQEIKKWSSSGWAVGIWVHLPLGYPMDHPALDRIWAEAAEANMTVAHHSFSAGYPGYKDLWSSPFIGRTASHPWGAMRAVAAFLGSGAFDRHPNLKFTILESGFGWLPFWAIRMQDQAEYMGYVPQLQHTMTEYMSDGRFFAAVVLHEGERMVKFVSDFLGEGVLMFSSDYPHPETRFPHSVDVVQEWHSLGQGLIKKVLWDNAVKCFGEP